MNKKIAITIVTILVLATLGYLYFRQNQNTAPNEEILTDSTGEVIAGPLAESEPVPESRTDTQSSGSETASKVSGSTAAVANAQSNQFNTAMANARKAMYERKYRDAVTYYKQAIKYHSADTAYAGLSAAYAAMLSWGDALTAADKAIELNSGYADHWTWKLTIMDDKTAATYSELKAVYQQGLAKVDYRLKANLVLSFARIAENNGQINDAISAWQEAIALFPEGRAIYQAEIDRLRSL